MGWQEIEKGNEWHPIEGEDRRDVGEEDRKEAGRVARLQQAVKQWQEAGILVQGPFLLVSRLPCLPIPSTKRQTVWSSCFLHPEPGF